MWGQLPEAPSLSPSLTSGLWSSLGCWDVATGTVTPTQLPLWPLGWMLVACLKLSPCTLSPSITPSGQCMIFSIALKRLSSYNNLGQHRSFLKFLVLVFLKISFLRYEIQHPLALEAFPNAVALVIPCILLPGETTALSLSCCWWMPSPP